MMLKNFTLLLARDFESLATSKLVYCITMDLVLLNSINSMNLHSQFSQFAPSQCKTDRNNMTANLASASRVPDTASIHINYPFRTILKTQYTICPQFSSKRPVNLTEQRHILI